MGGKRWTNCFLLVLAIGTSVSCAGHLEEEKECTLIGCENGAAIETALTFKYDDLRSATIALCRRNICVNGALTLPSEEPAQQSLIFAPFVSDAADAPVSRAVLQNEAGRWRVTFYWQDSLEALQDGDEYQLSVVSTRGGPLAMGAALATYKTTEPNGPGCGLCRSAVVKL